jgi:hypothetical protein
MELRDTLQGALSGAYTIERELGGGGMSRVFLAQEIALKRPVVIKVLPPELASAVSGERFKREIQLAAQLQHPHIVPVLSAGQAGDVTYYTMPFVDGESLRGKLSSSGEMPVGEAVRVLRDVAAALAYAHKHNLVHRDIKPDNVLLSDGYAVVTDFGVAKAITSSATGERGGLTSLGVALGTPAYMSPEQAAAEPNIDHRSDIYSFGILAYELLAGASPFAGRPVAVQLKAQVTEDPESLARRRPSVPAALAELIARCLQKRPADRPQTADEIVRALDTVVSLPTQPTSAVRAPRMTRPVLVGAGVFAAVAIAVAAYALRAPDAPVDEAAIAVFPFRVTASAPGLEYLREGGLPDLMSIKFSTGAGLRSSDVSVVLNAWKGAGAGDIAPDRLAKLAASLGAGQFVRGEVVGTPTGVIIRATLQQTRGRAAPVDASVEGTADSVASLVDKLVAQLLARRAGETGERLVGLTHTSLPALRAYLDGNANYRRGKYGDAVADFHRAFQIDTNFLPALVGEAKAMGWLGQTGANALRVAAWRRRDRLSGLDRMYVEAMAGSRAPGRTPFNERMASMERYLAAAPDNIEAWNIYADALFHYGTAAGVNGALEKSLDGFRRALAMDSTFAPAIDHLHQLHLLLGDTAATLRWARATLARLQAAGDTDITYGRVSWLKAELEHDTAARRRTRRPERIFGADNAQHEGIGVPDVDEQFAEWKEQTTEPTLRAAAGVNFRYWFLNTGRPRSRIRSDALYGLGAQAADFRAMDNVFWDGDSADAERSVANILAHPAVGTTQALLTRRAYEFTSVAYWATEHNRPDISRRAMTELRVLAAMPDTVLAKSSAATTLLALEAIEANRTASPAGLQVLARFDSTLRTLPGGPTLDAAGNLVAAKLWEKRGNLPMALAALRRKEYHLNATPFFQTTFLREEGRIAEALGDREAAISAYARYVALRYNPEPSLRADADRIRARLAQLKKESAGK